MAELFSGYYETVLAKDELIAEVHVPAQGTRSGACCKVTTGSADDWPALGVAVERDDKTVKTLSLVASAATDKATTLRRVEELLQGKVVGDDLLERAGDLAVDECEFIADVRGSVPYKRELMRVYVRRALRAAFDGKNGLH